MNEETLVRIAESLERIAKCMENKQAREINLHKKNEKKNNNSSTNVKG